MNKETNKHLGQVLEPVSTTRFFSDFWERKPLHISRSDTSHFSDLVSIPQLEALLSSHDLYFPAVQVTQSEKSIEVREYTDDDDRIIPQRLVQLCHDGATVIVSQANRLLGGLSEFSRYMQCALQRRCQTNVYLSPPGNKGFNAHFDTHDVFILQVSGCKKFNFYSGGVELPFSNNKFDSRTTFPGPVQEEIHLQPGDTLYIPRGVIHDALAVDDESSLHVTLGVFPIVLRDLVQEIVQVAAEKNVDFRHSMQESAWRQSDYNDESIARSLENLFSGAFSKENLREAVSRLRDDVALSAAGDCKGLLGSTHHHSRLYLDTVIAVREKSLMNVERQGQLLRMRTLGQILEFSEPMSTAIEGLLAAKQVQVSHLKGLNDEQKLALSQQLLREHVVELAPVSLTD